MGSQHVSDPLLSRRLRLANQLSISIVFITLPYTAIFWLLGSIELAGMVLFVVAGYLFVPLSSSVGWIHFARLLPVLTGSLAVTFFSVATGPDSGIYYYYLAVIVFPFVLFTWRERVSIFLGLLLPLLLYLFLFLSGFQLGPWVEISKPASKLIASSIFYSTGLTIAAAVLYLILAERRVIEKNETIIQKLEKEILTRKNAEEMARQASAKLKAVFDSATEAIWVVDRDMTFRHVNKKSSQNVGGYDVILGRTVWDLLGQEAGDHYAEIYRRVIQSGSSEAIESKDKMPTGETHYFSTTLSPVFRNGNSGQVDYLVGVSRDISEQKRIESELKEAKEKAEFANRTKDAFLANISHELRTPLGSILGFSELLRKSNEPLSDNAKRWLEAIERNGQHLHSLINDLLDLSAMNLDKIQIQNRNVNLNDEIEEIVNLTRDKSSVQSVKIVYKPVSKDRAEVCLDPLRLRQILIN